MYGYIFISTLLISSLAYGIKHLNVLLVYTAKYMSSNLFLANRPYQEIIDSDFQNLPFSLVKFSIDHKNKIVESSFFGIKKKVSVYTSYPKTETKKGFLNPEKQITKNELAKNDTIETKTNYFSQDSRLVSSLGEIFTQQPKTNFTKAILIAKNNEIIFEQYAKGFNQDSILPAWSISKSIINTLYGILDFKQELNLDQGNLFPEWENDDRKNITLRNLFQMNSGLKWSEDYYKLSDVTKMLYDSEDFGTYALKQPLKSKIGDEFLYSSGTSNILSKYLKNFFSENVEDYYALLKQFVETLGLEHFKMETDSSGVLVGSSYAWASTRDFLKFALLYCNDGKVGERQVLKPSWLEFSKTPSVESGMREYGAHVWLNKGEVNNSQNRLIPCAPEDTIIFKGYNGQRIYIISSFKLVICRFGNSSDAEFSDNDFLKPILKMI